MNEAAANLPDLVRSVVDQHRHERGPLLEVVHEIQKRLGDNPCTSAREVFNSAASSGTTSGAT